jgi:hypothetical protein
MIKPGSPLVVPPAGTAPAMADLARTAGTEPLQVADVGDTMENWGTNSPRAAEERGFAERREDASAVISLMRTCEQITHLELNVARDGIYLGLISEQELTGLLSRYRPVRKQYDVWLYECLPGEGQASKD